MTFLKNQLEAGGAYLELFETRAALSCLEAPLQVFHVEGLPGSKGYGHRKEKL